MERTIISVFGSSAPQAGDERYEEARLVGRLLAQAGFAVATGGYGGTMAGVSQGAAEAGGHVIGVTSSRMEAFRPTPANRWVGEEIRYESQQERLLHLVTRNEGMITLAGSVGTLSEMSLAWSLIQVGELTPRPLVVLGAQWPAVIDSLEAMGFLRPQDRALIAFASSPETAVRLLLKSRPGGDDGVNQ